MNTPTPDLLPPPIKSISSIIEKMPVETLRWITDEHMRYLDDYKFHQIDKLTDYLAGCDEVKAEREEFIAFVDGWARTENVDIMEYLQDYSRRFRAIRNKVDGQCEQILSDTSLHSPGDHRKAFWREFAYVNEQDSLHGMFLTSGRWYVNAMLPVIKELVYCSLPKGTPNRQDASYVIARRIITPQFAETPADYDRTHERLFSNALMPILQHYDRKLCYLFEEMSQIPFKGDSLHGLVEDVKARPREYVRFTDVGVYPPFAWHEYHSSRKPRNVPISRPDSIQKLARLVPTEKHERMHAVLDVLDVFKEYEVNYNNYNYKGRFCLISKYYYLIVARTMSDDVRANFLDAIIGDRFFDALHIIEEE